VRVVLDPDILISALITRGTPPDELYRAWLRGSLDLVTSVAQLDELADVLGRPRMRRFIDVDEAQALVENIDARAIILDDLPVVTLSPDAADNRILATAIAGRVDLIVSGDRKHMLTLGDVEGIPVLTAREALESIG